MIPPKDLFCGDWCEESFPGDQAPLASSQGGGCSPIPPPLGELPWLPFVTPRLALKMPGRVFLKICGCQVPSYLPVCPRPRAQLGAAELWLSALEGERQERRKEERFVAVGCEVYVRRVGCEGMPRSGACPSPHRGNRQECLSRSSESPGSLSEFGCMLRRWWDPEHTSSHQ